MPAARIASSTVRRCASMVWSQSFGTPPPYMAPLSRQNVLTATLCIANLSRMTNEGALVRRPMSYELTAWLGFLGRRRRVFDRLVASSGARPGDRVLDVGCGTGYLSRRAAAVVGPDRVVGVDLSPYVIA